MDNKNQKNVQYNRLFFFGFIIAVILIVGMVYFFLAKREVQNMETEYSAVFLTTGQVYFGKLTEKKREFIVLTDIYYLQKSSLQEEDKSAEVNLIKLGNELHGPTNRMEINKDHILYIESLAVNSRVIQAIKKNVGN